MENNTGKQGTPRREFLGSLAAGAAGIGLAAMALPLNLAAKGEDDFFDVSEADQWFNKITGKHRVVFDATRPHELMPFAWPKVFLITNEKTGTPAKDCSVVLVLRHDAIPYAFEDRLWAKYGFDEVFKAGELGPGFQAADAATAAKTRNPMWNTKLGDFKVPGLGAVPIGIKDLQADGVMICVCDAAITVYTAALSEKMKMTPEETKKDWLAGLIPGIQVVPSGVWALGRAQEHQCGYIFAG